MARSSAANLSKLNFPRFPYVGEAHGKFVEFTKSFLVRPTLSTLSSDARENGKGRRSRKILYQYYLTQRQYRGDVRRYIANRFLLHFPFFFFFFSYKCFCLSFSSLHHNTSTIPDALQFANCKYLSKILSCLKNNASGPL